MAFWNALSFRESCYTCQYARPERISDITIGDFWGLDIENKNGFEIDKGISCLLINTERGQKLFEEVSDRFVYVPRTLTEAVNGNANLQHPSLMHNKYRFLKQQVHAGIEYDAALRVCFKKEILKQRIKEFDNIIHIPIVATATKLKRAILGRCAEVKVF
jgi:coenzyme F420-reducing hydrogenase beta subunit